MESEAKDGGVWSRWSAIRAHHWIGLREKTKTTNRPVIFVCHSLGGLVCANALSRHHGTGLASAGLVEKTTGVVFLGTTFEGSSKAKWAGRALKVLEWKFLKSKDRSETRHFVEVACFFEQYAMYKAGIKIGLIVSKESARLPGIDPQSIEANHVNMCRFEEEDREGYKNISQRLSQWISDLDRQQKGSAARSQMHSVHMGDVNYHDKIENNRGVVINHANSTAKDGVNIIGSTNSNTYHGINPNAFGPTAG
ncbi:hypothetical protein EJ02DRAFT_472873 [Clathrospora elynae]|uniref:DUF676 domain-containing protein n=1 Tax=Clathrospora elynae TaxID=706981 RepID=A0A6A5SG81_9PLEO|nr:hypothetical protein EJ02DRAFT_472873 [Clathrospora elynae]